MNEDQKKLEEMLNRKVTIGEIVGGIVTMAAFAALAWLCLSATPSQMSAECEYLRTTIGE